MNLIKRRKDTSIRKSIHKTKKLVYQQLKFIQT